MAKKAATKKEKQHMGAVADLGCIPCYLDGHRGTPANIHHAKRFAGDRRNHMRVIGMCHRHHQVGPISRHDCNIDKFQERYGNDDVLLEIVSGMLACQMSEVF